MTPMPMPLASNTSMATLAAPVEDFLVRVRVLRRAPNAWALITDRVPEMGGVVGEGERENLSIPRRERDFGWWECVALASPSLLPRSCSLPEKLGRLGSSGRSGPEFARRGPILYRTPSLASDISAVPP